MKKVNEVSGFKPTLNTPTPLGSKTDSVFKKSMSKIAPSVKLKEGEEINEVDSVLTEVEQSLKKKIFNLSKMETLVFSDPRLSSIYDEMSVNGEEKYGYHYNETIMNMLFNDYVLNSTKYLQKYKMSIPKEKKRRDKSGINQLKKAGEIGMTKSDTSKKNKSDVTESSEPLTKVMFLVNEKNPKDPDLFAYFPDENYDNEGRYKTAYSHIGQHSSASPEYAAESRPATPEEYAPLKSELENIGYNLDVIEPQTNETTGAAGGSGAFSPALGYEKKVNEMTGSAGAADGGSNSSGSGVYVGPAAWSEKGDLLGSKGKPIRKPIFPGGKIVQENKNYLIDPSDFAKYIQALNEEDLSYQTKLGVDYKKSHTNSNNGLGVSEVPQQNSRNDLKRGIDDNTSLYVGQDVDKMRNDDVKILHNDMMHNNTMFPHPKNPNLQNDGISGKNENTNKTIYIKDKERVDNYIDDKTNAFSSDMVKNWDESDTEVEMDTIKTGAPDKPNLNTMEENTTKKGLIGKVNEKAKSASQQRLFGMADAIQKGELSPNKVGSAVKKIANNVSHKDVKDFAKTKTKNLPEKVRTNETDQTMIAKSSSGSIANYVTPAGEQGTGVPTGTQETGGMRESTDFESASKLFEELNNELNAYSIHHQKLMKMSEDRKIPTEIARDRIIAQNPTNFKKDLEHSGTKEIIDIEDELEWKDQQTDVPNDPQKLGQDVEKNEIKVTGGTAFKNVGDSTNNKGDEVPKRNMTSEEQKQVDLYRKGMHSWNYDNQPSKRFTERTKKEMGDKFYKMGEDQKADLAKQPMYNKDTQPIENGEDKLQFDKNKEGWNNPEGLKESMITGKYFDLLNKKHFVDFDVNEVKIIESNKLTENFFRLDFTALGNTYYSKSVDNKVYVNENTVKLITENQFYCDGKNVYVVKNKQKLLTEDHRLENESKNSVNNKILIEQQNKMKHLLNYQPSDFTNTKNIKNNRGF